jgi:hypothetical protein
MAATFTKIATVTVGSGGASSIDFSSIPATYSDLCLKFSLRTNNTGSTYDEMKLTFNNSGGTAYSERVLYGTGAAAGSASRSSQAYNQYGIVDADGATASTFGNGEIYVPNYAGNTNKSYSLDSVQETNATTAYIYLDAGLWANTSAITQITLTPVNGTSPKYMQYSTAYLYGIKNS